MAAAAEYVDAAAAAGGGGETLIMLVDILREAEWITLWGSAEEDKGGTTWYLLWSM